MTAMSEYHSNFADARKIAAGTLDRADAAGGGQHHLFDRLDWFESLHAACLANTEPMIAHASDGHAHLWLPMARTAPRRLSAISHWYSFAWRPIWSGRPDAPTKAVLARRLARCLRTQSAIITLSPLPEADGSAALMAQALTDAGWQVSMEATSHNHWLDTDGRSFADWWAARPGALRSTVARKSKKGLVQLEIRNSFCDAAWDEFEAVYRQSWKPAEGYPDFLREWARGEGAAGTLRLGIARIDGVAVAAQFWSTDDGVAYIHKLSHVAGHDALSPGTLLTHALFAQAFDEDKVHRIDFGTGDDGYKRDWMEASAPLMTIRAWDPRQPAAWASIAAATVRPLLSRLAARVRGR
ncbi:MAG: GNAT family N-acetyltransferase [Sphingopyxis sp.]